MECQGSVCLSGLSAWCLLLFPGFLMELRALAMELRSPSFWDRCYINWTIFPRGFHLTIPVLYWLEVLASLDWLFKTALRRKNRFGSWFKWLSIHGREGMATEAVSSWWHGLAMAAFHILVGQKPEGLRIKPEVNCLKVIPPPSDSPLLAWP